MKIRCMICVMLLVFMGCNQMTPIDIWMSEAEKPIKLIAKSEQGGITLMAADGKCNTIGSHYFVAKNISSCYEVGSVVVDRR
jgi:hypothetical protein